MESKRGKCIVHAVSFCSTAAQNFLSACHRRQCSDSFIFFKSAELDTTNTANATLHTDPDRCSTANPVWRSTEAPGLGWGATAGARSPRQSGAAPPAVARRPPGALGRPGWSAGDLAVARMMTAAGETMGGGKSGLGAPLDADWSTLTMTPIVAVP